MNFIILVYLNLHSNMVRLIENLLLKVVILTLYLHSNMVRLIGNTRHNSDIRFY